MKPQSDRQSALKKNISPQQSAYLYSSSYLFNQKRIQAKKLYAEKQQAKLKQFDDQFKLDISQSVSLEEEEPVNRQNQIIGRDQYQIAPVTLQQDEQIETILLSEQTQVDDMVKQLLELKEILNKCERSHRVMRKTELAQEDKQFLEQLMTEYGPPSKTNQYGNLQVTLSKLIGKIELNKKDQKKQASPKKLEKMASDASIIYAGKKETQDKKFEMVKEPVAAEEQKVILENLHNQNLPDSKNFCSIGLGIENKSRFTNKKDKSVVRDSYGLENFRKSRLLGSNNFCSIAEQHDKIFSPAPQIRKHRYSEYEQLQKSQAKRSLSEKKQEKKCKESQTALSPEENEIDQQSKKRALFGIEEMKKSYYPGLLHNQQPVKTQRMRYGSNLPTQKYRYSEHRAENQLHNIKKFPLTNQFIQNNPKIKMAQKEDSQIEKNQGRYCQIDESPVINHQYFGTSLSQNNFPFIDSPKNQLSKFSRLNHKNHTKQQLPKNKMQVSKINASSFVVEFNRIELEIDFSIVRKIKLMKNQIEVWSKEIGYLSLSFNQMEDYYTFYKRVVSSNGN